MISTPKAGALLKLNLLFGLSGLTTVCFAQELQLEDVVQRALASSPRVHSAQARVEAATQALRGAGAGFNPMVELAPGAGFTNGNAALLQRIDISGSRSAAISAAKANLATEVAGLQSIRQARAAEAATAYLEAVLARANLLAADEQVQSSRELVELVRKRVEVGEAAEVQALRADIQARRHDQEAAIAKGALDAKLSRLSALMGDSFLQITSIPSDLQTEFELPTASQAMDKALGNRPELAMAQSQLQLAQARLALAKSEGRPTLSAGLAADIWSLDRDPFDSDNLGFQAFLNFPLFDRGSLRSGVKAAEALVVSAKAEYAGTERDIRAEVSAALIELGTRRGVAANYRDTILPETAKLVQATTAGYQSGLTTLIEVLDAQQTARMARTEYLSALYLAAAAEIDLKRAMGTLAPQETAK
jgi:outer membrane protein TolC